MASRQATEFNPCRFACLAVACLALFCGPHRISILFSNKTTTINSMSSPFDEDEAEAASKEAAVRTTTSSSSGGGGGGGGGGPSAFSSSNKNAAAIHRPGASRLPPQPHHHQQQQQQQQQRLHQPHVSMLAAVEGNGHFAAAHREQYSHLLICPFPRALSCNLIQSRNRAPPR